MIGKKATISRIVPLFEVKDMVKERLDINEKGVEPTYEQNMVMDYSKKFVKLTPAKSRKLLEELLELEGMTEPLAVKILDILPEDMDELTLLISKNDHVQPDSLAKAFELVKKHRS